MIKTLNSPIAQFSVAESLLYLCKKPSGQPSLNSKPQIDFLLLDKQIQDLQHIQSKTCQEIVEFVDQHREQFIEINDHFNSIQDEIKNTETILKNLIPKIVQYKEKNYSSESGIQQFITNYEKKLIRKRLLGIAKDEAEFLIGFIQEFQNFINLNIEELTHWHKFYIAKLLKKFQYLKNLFDHPMVKEADEEYHGIENLLDSILQELQFYLSEQLSRLVADSSLRNKKAGQITLLEQVSTWYDYGNRLQIFYQTIQQTLLCRQIPMLESLLITNKQSLLMGKQQVILQQFYSNLFRFINKFPSDYPTDRILRVVYRFMNKKELNFQYSYVVPTFIISFNAYQDSLKIIDNEKIRQEMAVHHNWKLSLWAELRIKSIMDRSAKDFNLKLEGILVKWLDIIFKKNFMVKGTKSYMIKLGMMLVNKYCQQLEEIDFDIERLNSFVTEIAAAGELLNRKIREGFEQQFKQQEERQDQKTGQTQEQIKLVIESMMSSIDTALRKWIYGRISLVINNCKNSLENYKTFIMRVISNKKETVKSEINKRQFIMKPFTGFIKNNPELSQDSTGFLSQIIEEQVLKHYDSEYVKQIYNHCQSNLTTEQMKQVMEIVSLERSSLFKSEQLMAEMQ